MNTMTKAALSAYQQVDVSDRVLDATPYQLISMLYNAAFASLLEARVKMEAKDIGGKGKAISKAISIIDEGLKLSLNYEAGGELASNMSALYDYMTDRLLLANLKNDVALVTEVLALLSELKQAWDGISPAPEASPQGVQDDSRLEGDTRIYQRA